MVEDDINELRREVAKRLGGDVFVAAWEWDTCDEDWELPVYVTAAAPGREFYDAVCDLHAAPVEKQAEFVVEQLLNG